jgi:hypothetical protein
MSRMDTNNSLRPRRLRFRLELLGLCPVLRQFVMRSNILGPIRTYNQLRYGGRNYN